MDDTALPQLVRPPSTPVPWGVRDIILATLAAIVAVIIVLGVAVAVGITFRSTADSGFAVRVSVIATIFFQIGFFVVAVVAVRRHGLGLGALGFRSFHPIFFVGAYALLFVGFTIALIYALVLQALGIGDRNPQRIDLLVGTDVSSLLLGLLAGAIVAPVAEETFFRGFVLPGLRQRYGLVAGTIISSLLFALAHLIPQLYVPTFALGVLLAALRLYSGSIWPSIILHSSFNSVSLLAVYAVGQRGGFQ